MIIIGVVRSVRRLIGINGAFYRSTMELTQFVSVFGECQLDALCATCGVVAPRGPNFVICKTNYLCLENTAKEIQ